MRGHRKVIIPLYFSSICLLMPSKQYVKLISVGSLKTEKRSEWVLYLYQPRRCVLRLFGSMVLVLWSSRPGSEPGSGSRDLAPLLCLQWFQLHPLCPQFCPPHLHLSSKHGSGSPQSLGCCCTLTVEEAERKQTVRDWGKEQIWCVKLHLLLQCCLACKK